MGHRLRGAARTSSTSTSAGCGRRSTARSAGSRSRRCRASATSCATDRGRVSRLPIRAARRSRFRGRDGGRARRDRRVPLRPARQRPARTRSTVTCGCGPTTWPRSCGSPGGSLAALGGRRADRARRELRAAPRRRRQRGRRDTDRGVGGAAPTPDERRRAAAEPAVRRTGRRSRARRAGTAPRRSPSPADGRRGWCSSWARRARIAAEALADLRNALFIIGPLALLARDRRRVLARRHRRSARSRRCAVGPPRSRRSSPASGCPWRERDDELERLGSHAERDARTARAGVERERGFVSDAGHELRTPLALLRAELDVALHQAQGEDELRAAVRQASDETDRLVQLAADLLLIASSDQGELPLRRESLRVSDAPRERPQPVSLAERRRSAGDPGRRIGRAHGRG